MVWNDDVPDDICIAANTGLLKTHIETDDLDSASFIAENIKGILLEEEKNELLESDYEYFELYCEACFEFVRYLNFIEQKVPDTEMYQVCEATIDIITTLVLNVIENAHRDSRLRNYDLLIQLYMLEGNLTLKPHKINKLDYTDWAVIYLQQALKLYNKAIEYAQETGKPVGYLEKTEQLKGKPARRSPTKRSRKMNRETRDNP